VYTFNSEVFVCPFFREPTQPNRSCDWWNPTRRKF